MSAESYRNWIEPVRLDRLSHDGAFRLVAPNSDVQARLESEFSGKILAAAHSAGIAASRVLISIDERGLLPRQRSFNFEPQPQPQQFTAKYTFERFVVGSCNEFAHAASQAVASKPAEAYNPLYLYAGTGMGKTHLLNAIGHKLHRDDPGTRVEFVTAEEFMNDMIKSIRFNNMKNFHDRFREADALLVDDIQVIGSKERTQEEFFHTFNALHNRGKQIVLTSDTDPSRLPGVVSRLRSRFSWGLMADIQPPDLETKMAILDRKSEELGTRLPEDVRTYVATRVNSNIRELEERVNQLVARSRFLGNSISLGLVKSLFRAAPPRVSAGPTIEMIQRAVAREFGLQTGDLSARRNARHVAHPRQIAMYICKMRTRASLSEIGRAFDRHHTTVLHSIRKIERNIEKDKELLDSVTALIEQLSTSDERKIA